MAIHETTNSMIKEALQEYIEVAGYCISFDKNKSESWDNSVGCYGYPAGLLLLSIVDALGTQVIGGDVTRRHFEILNHQDYYNLGIDVDALEALYKEYRCRLSHNAHLGENVILTIGTNNDPIIEVWGSIYKLNLLPFFLCSKRVVQKFLASA